MRKLIASYGSPVSRLTESEIFPALLFHFLSSALVRDIASIVIAKYIVVVDFWTMHAEQKQWCNEWRCLRALRRVPHHEHRRKCSSKSGNFETPWFLNEWAKFQMGKASRSEVCRGILILVPCVPWRRTIDGIVALSFSRNGEILIVVGRFHCLRWGGYRLNIQKRLSRSERVS